MMNTLFLARYSLSWTGNGAQCTAGAQRFIDFVMQQLTTNRSRTLFLVNMRLVLVSKIFNGCKHGIWSSLPQSTKGILLNLLAQLQQSVDIFGHTISFGNSG